MAISKKMLTRVIKSSKKFGFDDTTIRVLIDRFLRKNRKGYVIETPEGMFRRTAATIAAIDREFGATEEEIADFADEIYESYTNQRFIATRPLVNSGRPYPFQQLSSCYVLPIKDTLDGIFETLYKAAFLQKWDGAEGIDFSPIRPRGDIIKGTGGKSSGPISFMKVFDTVTAAISEGATRRGANMGVLRIDHPDIEEFITAKQTPGVLENFNVSIGITDDFMSRVAKNKYLWLVNPRTSKKVRKIRARRLFSMIVKSMWKSAEPGMIFLDTINKDNPTPNVGEITAVNLCGEQPLLPYESCNLCNINLTKFLVSKKKRGKNKKLLIDWNGLKKTTGSVVHFLDNTIEANHYLFKEIENVVKEGNRKIGVGVMGWADLLFEMGIPYDSHEALKLGQKIMKTVNEAGHKASQKLGEERGSFPNFIGSVWEKDGVEAMRNASVTTIAPTGNAAILGGCSHAIEPHYAIAYTRVGLGRGKHFGEWDRFTYVNEVFERECNKRVLLTKKIKEKILETGSIQNIKGIPADMKAVFKTALDLKPEAHVRMQAAFQKNVDSAISKTINMAQNTTIKDVEKVVKLAHRLKCKGITIYRDQSRDKQVLTAGIDKKKKKKS